MTRALVQGLLVATLAAAGCGSKDAPQPAPADVWVPGAPTDGRLGGMFRFADEMHKVAPFIIHEPRMDLFTQCAHRRDAEKKAGNADAALCYGSSRRDGLGVKTIRVESTSAPVGGVIRWLAAKNEAAHVLAEPGGAVHQMLDFAYAPRRAGGIQAGELRVILIHGSTPTPAAAHPVVAELKRLFPNAKLKAVVLTTPSPKSETSP